MIARYGQSVFLRVQAAPNRRKGRWKVLLKATSTLVSLELIRTEKNVVQRLFSKGR